MSKRKPAKQYRVFAVVRPEVHAWVAKRSGKYGTLSKVVNEILEKAFALDRRRAEKAPPAA